MKVNAVISSYAPLASRNLKRTKAISVNFSTEKPISNVTMLSFKGNPAKKPNQIAAYGTESNFLGGIYKAGGLGDVAEALPEAVGIHGKEILQKDVDMRTFLPYYSYDSAEAEIYVAKKGTDKKTEAWNKWLEAEKEAKKTNKKNRLPKPPQPTRDGDYIKVTQDYVLKEGERFALITETQGGNNVSQVHFLEDVGLRGRVKRIGKDSLEMTEVPYRIFEVDTRGKRKDRMYLIHTPEVSSGKSAYGIDRKYSSAVSGTTAYGGSTAYGGKKVADGAFVKHFGGNAAGDMFYTEQIRAMERSLEAMDIARHGNFNPQNLVLHDRFPAVMLTDAMEFAKEGNQYWNGIRYVDIFHNPGRGYQGVFGNPLDFFRVVANEADVARLKASPNYEKVKAIAEKIGKGTATQEECEQIYRFFEPYYKQFMDSEGCFNMTKIALAAVEDSPELVSAGHVSKYFGKEAADFATEDIAKGLTGDFQRLDKYIISVTNGAKPANMATNAQDGFFGTGTLNSIFKDVKDPRKYTPYSMKDGAEKIFKAKNANKANLINILAEATEKSSTDPDALAKVFFSDGKISGIRGKQKDLKLTLGGISKHSAGDLLFISWGRPDPQKGLKTTARAFRMFLQDESIPLETRKRCKLLFGAGGGNDAWRPVNGIEPSEWKGIQEEMKKIAELEKGAFKGNALYVNGLFPNRLANCADLAVLTSRYEPCGITPFESYATGTPVLSIKTGGAPDFVKEGKTGFLTKDPFMLSAEKLGLPKGVSSEVLDEARVENSAKQVRDKLKEYLKPLEDGSFESRQKGFIETCFNEKIEWHNNSAYNNGKSALEIYLKDKCRTQDNEVNGIFKSNGRGAFDETAFDTVKKGRKGWWRKLSKTRKTAVIVGLGAIAAGATYGIYKSCKGKNLTVDKSNKDDTKHLSAIV